MMTPLWSSKHWEQLGHDNTASQHPAPAHTPGSDIATYGGERSQMLHHYITLPAAVFNFL